MKLRGFVAGSVVAVALTLTACGGSTDTTTSGNTSGNTGATAQTINVTVPGEELKFDKAQIDATANQPFKIAFKNGSTALQHNFVIRRPGGTDVVLPGPAETNYADPGKEATSTDITLPAGTYEFVCTFPGHEAAGMKGNVVVK